MKTVKIFGKTISVAILALLIMSSVGLAALLTYYGVIVTDVDVHQSIKLLELYGDPEVEEDWMQCINGYESCTIENNWIPEPSPGGEKFCYKYWLKNKMSVEGEIEFETTCAPDCAGIDTHIVVPLEYYKEATAVTYNYYKPEGLPVEIVVEDGECFLTFTFDFPIDGDQGNGNMGYGVIISTDGVNPLFQVHNNDGTCSAYPWGEHLYSPWDPYGGWHGWHTSEEDWNTPVSEVDWIEATGTRYKDGKDDGTGNDPTPNPNGTFTVTINKCKLISLIPLEEQEHIYWAVHFGAGGFYDYGGLSSYPEDFAWDNSDVVVPCPQTDCNYEDAEIGEQVSGLVLQSGEVQDFCLCYKFAQNIAPGSYTLKTKIVPVLED